MCSRLPAGPATPGCGCWSISSLQQVLKGKCCSPSTECQKQSAFVISTRESSEKDGKNVGLAERSQVSLVTSVRMLERPDTVALRATKEGMEK